jgi:2-hydroxy-3-oxopropionate reductase
MSKPKIGFIGLGIMGLPMAKNLIKADYPLIAYDLNENPLNEIANSGAQKATSNADVAANCDIIITMLPNSPDVQKAVFSEAGIAEGLSSGQILIDMSSIAPLVSQEIAHQLSSKGVAMLDAPVSGGQEKAQSATLAIMVGGKEDTFNTCKPILEVLGNPVLVGDIGAGGITKLVNQSIVAVNIAIVAEALLLGKKANVDPKRIFDAIKSGLAGSQCLTDKAPRMLSANYDPGFRMKLHVKDLTNVLSTSQALHNAMPLTAQVMEMMQSLINDGCENLDHGGLALFYEKINGVSLKEE